MTRHPSSENSQMDDRRIPYRVDPDYDACRLDRWLRHHFRDISHGTFQKMIRRGWVRVNGRRAGTHDLRVYVQDVVCLPRWWIEQWQGVPGAAHEGAQDSQVHDVAQKHGSAGGRGLRSDANKGHDEGGQEMSAIWRSRIAGWILHEDARWIVVNKPQGMACQGGSGQRVHIDLLMQHWRPERTIRLTHRLDVDTSGVLVLAQTLKAAQHLTEAFRKKAVHKTYWALVHGVPAPQGTLSQPLVRRGRIMVSADSHDPEALDACTHYRVVGSTKPLPPSYSSCHGAAPRLLGRDQVTVSSVCQEFSWVVLRPRTGRMHQLRAHMAHLGHPIVGDSAYGSPLPGPLALHCFAMSFEDGSDPARSARMHFQAPPPPAFVQRWHNEGGKVPKECAALLSPPLETKS